jgi:hypothetical protein
MAYEIGERVTNSFTGPGTVTGELVRDPEFGPTQTVKFDNTSLGERRWAISKLFPAEDGGDVGA